MKYGAFLFVVLAIWLHADQRNKPLNPDTEGKKLYRPIAPQIDLREESKVQEQDQNATHLGGKE